MSPANHSMPVDEVPRETNHAAMSDIMNLSGVSKHSKEINKSTCQKGSEQSSLKDDVLAQATTQIPAFTSPSSAPDPSTDTIQWWPTKPHPKVKMDISSLSKLENYTKIIAGREKGCHAHISAPRSSTPEPPSTLSKPLIQSRRRSLPADVRLDVLKAPTTFDEWAALLIPLTERQTGDNIFRLTHLLKNKWDQDQWIFYFSKRKETVEKAIKEAQAVLGAWKAVRAEWEAAFARWEAREKYHNRRVEVLQGLAHETIDPNDPDQVRYIDKIVEENAELHMMQFEREREAAHEKRKHEKEAARLRERLGGFGSKAQSEKQLMKNALDAQIRELQRDVDRYKGERDEARGERDTAKNDRDSARLMRGLQRSEITRLEREKRELKEQLKARDEAILKLKEENTAIDEVQSKLRSVESDLEKKSEEYEKAIRQADEQLSRKSEEIESLQTQLPATHCLKKELDTASAQITSLQKSVAETEARAQTSVRDSEAFQSLLTKFNIVKTDLNALTEKHKRLQGQLDGEMKSRATEKTKLGRENANLKNQVKVLKENKKNEKIEEK